VGELTPVSPHERVATLDVLRGFAMLDVLRGSPCSACCSRTAIFGVQIAVSHLWLRWFRFGPLEWVWRSIVYWRPQPMQACD